MIEIFVYGPKENGFLDMDSDNVIDIEALQPAFDEDLSTGEYSIPFDIPWNDNNRRLLGYPERVTNFNYIQNYYRCTVYDQGVPEMQNARLTILGKSGSLNYTRGVFNASISGTRGLFGAAIKNKSLKDVDYGPIISWINKDSREWATWLSEQQRAGALVDTPYLRFAPVAIENFIDKDRSDFTTEFLVKDCVNYVIGKPGTEISNPSWIFARPKASDPNTATTPANPEHKDYRTIPFMTVQHIVRSIFKTYGYQVLGDWVDDGAFKNLCLYNNYALEVYNTTSNQDNNRKINLRNHVPDRRITEFLKSVFGFFGLFPLFSYDNRVRLVYRKNNLRYKRIASLNDYLEESYEGSYEDGQQQQEYKLDYEWDSNEGYHSDRVRDNMDDKTLVATVPDRSWLDALDIGRQLTTDDIAYVTNEGMWYQMANATTTPLRWDCIAENLNPYKEGDADNAIQFGISPLPQYVSTDATTGLKVMMPYVGTRMKGSYTNNKGALVQNPYGLHLFYATIDNISTTLVVPITHNRPWGKSPNPANSAQYSLAWQGADGMALNYHTQWQQALRNKETITFILTMSRQLQQLLDNYNVFEILGTLFILKQTQRQLPMGATIKLQMLAL